MAEVFRRHFSRENVAVMSNSCNDNAIIKSLRACDSDTEGAYIS